MIKIIPYPYDGEKGEFTVEYNGTPLPCIECKYSNECVIIKNKGKSGSL